MMDADGQVRHRRPQEGHDPGVRFNVYPNEVEDVLAAHRACTEVAVIGVPDAQSGEAVKLLVVRRSGRDRPR